MQEKGSLSSQLRMGWALPKPMQPLWLWAPNPSPGPNRSTGRDLGEAVSFFLTDVWTTVVKPLGQTFEIFKYIYSNQLIIHES